MTADKVFEKLGYKIDICEDYGLIRYKHIEKECYIRFYLDGSKEFDANEINADEIFPLQINMELLKAINKKCEELGWK